MALPERSTLFPRIERRRNRKDSAATWKERQGCTEREKAA
jgi:hypothetical protein